MKSILGRKVGMTQVFTTTGEVCPVTVVEVLPNVVLQKKTLENDGYEALQVGYEDKKVANKPETGIVTKANTTPKKFVRELKGDELNGYNVGDEIKVTLFKVGDVVDVQAKSKGKGFSGVIKRWGQHRGPMGHGSGSHRLIGSLASNGRYNMGVEKGHHMPGHHGNKTTTVQNLVVLAVDEENSVLLIRGPIPGANRSLVVIKSASKAQLRKPVERVLVDYSTLVKKEVVEETVTEQVEETVTEQA